MLGWEFVSGYRCEQCVLCGMVGTAVHTTAENPASLAVASTCCSLSINNADTGSEQAEIVFLPLIKGTLFLKK